VGASSPLRRDAGRSAAVREVLKNRFGDGALQGVLRRLRITLGESEDHPYAHHQRSAEDEVLDCGKVAERARASHSFPARQ
jgi:hypothetical protein